VGEIASGSFGNERKGGKTLILGRLRRLGRQQGTAYRKTGGKLKKDEFEDGVNPTGPMCVGEDLGGGRKIEWGVGGGGGGGCWGEMPSPVCDQWVFVLKSLGKGFGRNLRLRRFNPFWLSVCF